MSFIKLERLSSVSEEVNKETDAGRIVTKSNIFDNYKKNFFFFYKLLVINLLNFNKSQLCFWHQ